MPARAGSSPARRPSRTGPRSRMRRRALRDSGLGVGAHLALVGHQGPVLQAREVPTLVDHRGRLASGWRPFLSRCALGRVDPDDVRREFAAQVEVLRSNGLTLTHLDTHQNLHLWPSIARVDRSTSRASNDVPAIRVTRSAGRSPIALGVRHFSTRLESRARKANVQFPDATAGFDEAGRLDLDRLRGAIERFATLRVSSAELVCHPGHSSDHELGALGWDYRGQDELDALVSTEARVTRRARRLPTRHVRRSRHDAARQSRDTPVGCASCSPSPLVARPSRRAVTVPVPVGWSAAPRSLYVAIADRAHRRRRARGQPARRARDARLRGPAMWSAAGAGSTAPGTADIADHGYYYIEGVQSSVAFFPGYPLVARPLARAIHNTPLALIIVTWIAGLATLMLFATWCARRLERRTAILAVACFALYPYGWFLYGAGYADALFLAFAIGAFVLLEADQPLLAGLAGAGAAATRPIGVAVAVGLLLRAIERRGGLPARAADQSSSIAAKLGIPARLNLRVLRPARPGRAAGAGGADRVVGVAVDALRRPVRRTRRSRRRGTRPRGRTPGSRSGSAGSCSTASTPGIASGSSCRRSSPLVALVAVPFVARRFGAAYGAYTLFAVGLAALATKDFQGMGRYMLGAFPLFALAGALLAERPRAACAGARRRRHAPRGRGVRVRAQLVSHVSDAAATTARRAYASESFGTRVHTALRWRTCPFREVADEVPRHGRDPRRRLRSRAPESLPRGAGTRATITGVDIDDEKLAVARRAGERRERRRARGVPTCISADWLPDARWDAIVEVDMLYLLGRERAADWLHVGGAGARAGRPPRGEGARRDAVVEGPVEPVPGGARDACDAHHRGRGARADPARRRGRRDATMPGSRSNTRRLDRGRLHPHYVAVGHATQFSRLRLWHMPARFPIRFTGANKAMVLLGVVPEHCRVEVDDGELRVRMAWLVQARRAACQRALGRTRRRPGAGAGARTAGGGSGS